MKWWITISSFPSSIHIHIFFVLSTSRKKKHFFNTFSFFAVSHKIHCDRTNTGKKLKCPFCERLYGYETNLRAHIRQRHQGIRVPCPFCSRTFTRNNTVRRHIAREHKHEISINTMQTAQANHANWDYIKFLLPPRKRKSKVNPTTTKPDGRLGRPNANRSN